MKSVSRYPLNPSPETMPYNEGSDDDRYASSGTQRPPVPASGDAIVVLSCSVLQGLMKSVILPVSNFTGGLTDSSALRKLTYFDE